MNAIDLKFGFLSDTWFLVGLPFVVALLTSIATAAVTRRNAAVDRRRVRYAEAMSTLVAWIEFPYRVRRRTSDDSETLTRLADRAHDLQERLAFDRAWISTDSTRMGHAHSFARQAIDKHIKPAIKDAWNSKPVSSPDQMVLGDWWPTSSCTEELARLQKQIDTRFKWWRRSTVTDGDRKAHP